MTIRQLRAVYAHIERRCVAERWTNFKGELLTPEAVTLYDATRYMIKPATSARTSRWWRASGPQRPVVCEPLVGRAGVPLPPLPRAARTGSQTAKRLRIWRGRLGRGVSRNRWLEWSHRSD